MTGFRGHGPFVAAFIAMALVSIGALANPARRESVIQPTPEIRSVNGVLTATLVASPRELDFGDIKADGATFNGLYPGPVLRVHPGDVMRIRLINHLQEPTNLHFHGLETSPLGHGDNTHIVVAPGESFDYEVKISKNQVPGIFWYHDHMHGLSEKHCTEGLTGALIVEGFARQFPELRGVTEKLLVLKDYPLSDDDKRPAAKFLHGIVQTINGRTETVIKMRPDETQLWHIVNQSSKFYFHLHAPDHAFRIIGDDGAATTHEIESETLDIAPAARVSVLVNGGSPGTYELRSEKVFTGIGADRKSYRVLAHLAVSGKAAKPVPEIARFPTPKDLRAAKIDATRTMVFSQLNDDENYFIDSKKFDMNRVDLRVPLGNVEEWTIKNTSDDLHVFHIHQVRFQIVEIDGKPQSFDGTVDTVRVPERGEVKIRLAFTNRLILGAFMIHCHVFRHEDKGMMAQIEVYDPANPVDYALEHNGLARDDFPTRGSVLSLRSLIDQNGRVVTDRTFAGIYRLIYFGYTFCPDACPTTLQNMGQAIDALGTDGARVQPIFVTIDPARDTTKLLAGYVPAFHKRFIGLTGAPKDIVQIARRYRVKFNKVREPGTPVYLMEHSSYVYLESPDGRFVTAFPGDADPSDMASTIRRYLTKTAFHLVR